MPVTKRGNTWQYTIDFGIIEGKRKRVSKSGFKTKKEATLAYEQMKDQYNKSSSFTTISKISFADYIEIYYNEYVINNCKYRTQETYRDYIENHIKPYFGNYKLKDIKTSTIYNFVIELSKKYSKNHCDNIKSFLNSSLKYAVFPKEFILKNPMDDLFIKNIKYKNGKEKVILTKEDMNKVFKYLEKYPHYYLPVAIMYHTGMRISEVCGLTWDNVDLDNRIIHVRQQLQFAKGIGYRLVDLKTKTSIRDISFSNTLYEILLEKKIEHDSSNLSHNHVCSCKNKNKILTKQSMTDGCKLIKRDVCPFHTHAVRHLHATMLIEAGCPIKDVSRRLGHSNIDITYNIYVELSQKQKDKTKELLDVIF